MSGNFINEQLKQVERYRSVEPTLSKEEFIGELELLFLKMKMDQVDDEPTFDAFLVTIAAFCQSAAEDLRYYEKSDGISLENLENTIDKLRELCYNIIGELRRGSKQIQSTQRGGKPRYSYEFDMEQLNKIEEKVKNA